MGFVLPPLILELAKLLARGGQRWWTGSWPPIPWKVIPRVAGRGRASSLTDFVLLTCQIPCYPNHTRDSKHLLSMNSEPVLSVQQPIEPPYRPVMWSLHLHPPARKQPQRCSLPASEHTAGWWQREATHPVVQQALFNTTGLSLALGLWRAKAASCHPNSLRPGHAALSFCHVQK